MSNLARNVLRLTATRKLIPLEYSFDPRPRWGYGRPAHPQMLALIEANRDRYQATLQHVVALKDALVRIDRLPRNERTQEPAWINGTFPGLDAASLYGLLVLGNPRRYLEVGSGNSTRFARRAIRDHGLRTRITSIDPRPRREIDAICDEVVRRPLEEIPLGLVDGLPEGDVLFVDGSHRCFQNSDATVIFIDVLPRLRRGVFVHIHDVYLPYDYPPAWKGRYYSEQYLLASHLLARRGEASPVVLPNTFISEDAPLREVVAPLWSDPRMHGVERHGGSFWFEVT